MRKILLSILLCTFALNVIAQTFSEPQVGKRYKIKGDHASLCWLTPELIGSGTSPNSIKVSSNEAEAAIFERTENGFRVVSTGKYLGMNGSVISYVDEEKSVTIHNTGGQYNNEGKYAIKVESTWLYNNSTVESPITHESSNWMPAIERFWGFIEVPDKVCNVVGRITAADLMAKTEPTYIAMRNLSFTNNNWFTGGVSSPNLTVFVWEPATDGKFYLKRYADESYLQASSISFGAKGTAATFEAICPTSSGAGKTKFNNDIDTNPFINIEGDPSGDPYIVRFAKNDNAWINVQRAGNNPVYNSGQGGYTIQHVYEVEFLDAYTVNISDAKYASFFAASECTVPEGVTAYYAKSEGVDLANEKIVLTEIENDIIPANTGVILYAPKADEYTFKASRAEAAELEGNLLEGTPASMNICMDSDQSAYVLSKQNSGIGLYMAEMTAKNVDPVHGGGGKKYVFLNNARKAYLPASALPTSASVQGFKFDDFTSTAIEGVVTGNEGAKVIYDLSGRRLNNITNAGVYIINGKKILVK